MKHKNGLTVYHGINLNHDSALQLINVITLLILAQMIFVIESYNFAVAIRESTDKRKCEK